MSADQKIFKKDGVWTVDGRPRETVQLMHQSHPSNIPNKTIVTFMITFPPNGATPPHTHAGSAVTAVIHKGASLNQMIHAEDSEGVGMGGVVGEARVYQEGEMFYEAPGCKHLRSENNTDAEAKLVAILVADRTYVEENGVGGLVVLDADVEEREREREKRRKV